MTEVVHATAEQVAAAKKLTQEIGTRFNEFSRKAIIEDGCPPHMFVDCMFGLVFGSMEAVYGTAQALEMLHSMAALINAKVSVDGGVPQPQSDLLR